MDFRKIKVNEKFINKTAIVSFIFIFIYEQYKYLEKILKSIYILKSIIHIFYQLAYAYVGSYIFYKLLSKKDKDNNYERAKKVLIPILKETVSIYSEFLITFRDYSHPSSFKHWSMLKEKDFNNIFKKIKCDDKFNKFGIAKGGEIYSPNYIEYIQFILKDSLENFREVRWNLDILDYNTAEYISNIINELRDKIPIIDELIECDNIHNDLYSVMSLLYEYHTLIVALNKHIYSIYK